MKNNMMPSNGHRIHGFSSETFIDAREIIKSLGLKGNEVFMDAGCGDGHVRDSVLCLWLYSTLQMDYMHIIFHQILQELFWISCLIRRASS